MRRVFVFCMRRIYTHQRTKELSGIGSLSRVPYLITCLVLAASSAACTTVALYEPVSADISLIADASPLQQPSDAFCKETREKGLATGEASLAQIGDILSGKDRTEGAYWRLIGADKGTPAVVVTRIRNDMKASATGIDGLTKLAQSLMADGAPTRADVTQFERALIHARQARDSLSDAFVQVNKRTESEYQITLELAQLDESLGRARRTADELAASRAPDTDAAGIGR
jgi:hypothetical protein